MGLYRVRTVFSGPAGTPWLSTLYFDTDGGTAQQAAVAAGAFWAAVDNYISNTVTWQTEADVTLLDESTGLATGATGTAPSSGVGGAPGNMVPRSSQALVRWLTGVYTGGRQIRGRTFVPGLTQDAVWPGGVVDGTERDAIAGAAAALIADANSVLQVYSKAHLRADTVTAANVWAQFAVLRSRRD